MSPHAKIWVPRLAFLAGVSAVSFVLSQFEWVTSSPVGFVLAFPLGAATCVAYISILIGLGKHFHLNDDQRRARLRGDPDAPPRSVNSPRVVWWGRIVSKTGLAFLGLGVLSFGVHHAGDSRNATFLIAAGVLAGSGVVLVLLSTILRPTAPETDTMHLPISLTFPEPGEPTRGPVRDANP